MAYAPSERVPVGEDQVAVAITPGILGSHLGVVYQNCDGVSKLFHLAFHQTLLIDDYPSLNWLVACVPVDEIAGAQIVALLDGAAKRYQGSPKMPGSFDYGVALWAGEGSIAPDGSYAPRADCDGYTCSSIVAEIFRSFGFPLVDLSTWPDRAINRAWGQAIVCMLTAYGASAEHVQAVTRNISGLRLRPEELAAAAERFQLGKPSTFADIETRADEVMAQVLAECTVPQPPPSMSNCVAAFQDAVAASKASCVANDSANAVDGTTPGTAKNDAIETPVQRIDQRPKLRWHRHGPKRRRHSKRS